MPARPTDGANLTGWTTGQVARASGGSACSRGGPLVACWPRPRTRHGTVEPRPGWGGVRGPAVWGPAGDRGPRDWPGTGRPCAPSLLRGGGPRPPRRLRRGSHLPWVAHSTPAPSPPDQWCGRGRRDRSTANSTIPSGRPRTRGALSRHGVRIRTGRRSADAGAGRRPLAWPPQADGRRRGQRASVAGATRSSAGPDGVDNAWVRTAASSCGGGSPVGWTGRSPARGWRTPPAPTLAAGGGSRTEPGRSAADGRGPDSGVARAATCGRDRVVAAGGRARRQVGARPTSRPSARGVRRQRRCSEGRLLANPRGGARRCVATHRTRSPTRIAGRGMGASIAPRPATPLTAGRSTAPVEPLPTASERPGPDGVPERRLVDAAREGRDDRRAHWAKSAAGASARTPHGTGRPQRLRAHPPRRWPARAAGAARVGGRTEPREREPLRSRPAARPGPAPCSACLVGRPPGRRAARRPRLRAAGGARLRGAP